jgi:hypothetical protein
LIISAANARAVGKDANMNNENMGAAELVDERIRCEEVTTRVFHRLHTLVQKGYAPDFHGNFVGAFWLHHPAKGYTHNNLYLYPSGTVVSWREAEGAARFDLEDDREFQNFLRAVPVPTIFGRARRYLLNIWAWIVFWGAILIYYFTISYSMDYIWSFMKKTFSGSNINQSAIVLLTKPAKPPPK